MLAGDEKTANSVFDGSNQKQYDDNESNASLESNEKFALENN
tara:strand:- start:1711 stop:1836 length:126 start_codon:yes stop_codon:yes gene_type:complete